MRWKVVFAQGGHAVCEDEVSRDLVLDAHRGAAWAVPIVEREHDSEISARMQDARERLREQQKAREAPDV
jgi:hypothetical protein